MNHTDDVDQFVADVHAVLASTLVTTMKEKIGGLFEKYAVYKETHDAVMRIPAVRSQRPDPASLAMSEPGHDGMLIQRLISENDALKLQIEEMKSAHAAYSAAPSSVPECGELPNDEHCSSTANIQLIITDIINNVSATPAQNNEIVFEVEDDGSDQDVNGNLLAEEEEEEDEEEVAPEEAEDEEEVAPEEAEDEEEVAPEEEEDEEAEDEEAEDEEEEDEEEVAPEEAEDEEAEDEEEVAPEEAEDEEEVAPEEAEDEEEVAHEEEEEEEEVEVEVEVEVAPEEEEEVEVNEVEIKGKPYFTTDEISGIIYECTKDGDIGNEVGRFVGGRPKFDKK
jgi:hypothetical protein